MPDVTVFSNILWVATIISYVGLTFTLLCRSAAREWLPFIIYAASDAALEIGLMILFRSDSPAAYFWTYWIGRCVISGLRLWLIWAVAAKLIAVNKSLRLWHLRAMVAFTVIAITFSAVLTLSVRSPYYMAVSRIAMSIDRWLALAACVLFIAAVYSIDLLGIRWRRRTLSIGIGLALQGIIFTGFAWVVTLREFTREQMFWASTIRDIADLAVVVIWIIAFLQPQKRVETLPFSALRFSKLEELLKDSAERALRA